MKIPVLGARLASAAGLVRQGAYLADIGTDHAFLPLFLLSSGKIGRAVCSDINEGPLASARENISEAGFSHLVDFRLTDGAGELAGLGITDYAICGMGGELIADIIAAAPQLFSLDVRLILQPMTRQGHLRRYLSENGFDILREEYSTEGERAYVALLCEYSGTARKISDFEAEFGRLDSCDTLSPARRKYIEIKKRALTKAAKGKIAGGEEYPPELSLLMELERLNLV